MRRIRIVMLSSLLLTMAVSESAAQVNVRISDVASFKGPRVNRLQGLGLVVGLAGTGDGGDYARTIEPLANLLKRYANPVVSMDELSNTKNVALVTVQAELPASGAREGDRLDVQVSAIGNCKSLRGGRLLAAPLQHHSLAEKTIIGFAMGPLQLLNDDTEVNATVSDGLVMEENMMVSFVASGAELLGQFNNAWIRADQRYVTVVIDDSHAGFGLAAAIAEQINDERGVSFKDAQLALAIDEKNIIVRVPEVHADDPVPFLRDIESLTPLLPERGSRIMIHRAKQFIAVDGEVRISPVIIAVGGLIVTVVRDADGEIRPPGAEQQRFVGLDPSHQGGATLKSLLDQLNQIKVPIGDQISVIEELARMGKIHAKLRYEE